MTEQTFNDRVFMSAEKQSYVAETLKFKFSILIIKPAFWQHPMADRS